MSIVHDTRTKTSLSRKRLRNIRTSAQYCRNYSDGSVEVNQSAGTIISTVAQLDNRYGDLIDAIEAGTRQDALDALMAVLDQRGWRSAS